MATTAAKFWSVPLTQYSHSVVGVDGVMSVVCLECVIGVVGVVKRKRSRDLKNDNSVIK